MKTLMKILRKRFYFQSLLLMTIMIAFSPAQGICDTYSDDFESTSAYWREVGTSSGTFSTDVGSGGTGTSVRLVDTDTGFHMPALAADNAQYFGLFSAVVQAEVLPNSTTGSGGVGFGVYDDNGNDLCAAIGAGLIYIDPSWVFVIIDRNEYDSEPYIIESTPVTIDANQFHLIRLESDNGNLTATLTLDDESTISISGPQRLDIDVAGIGLWAQNLGDFSFDNFYMEANPDDRHMVFNEVAIVTESSSLDVAFPTWSHDGKKVAYIERDDVDLASWNIWVKQIDPLEPAYKCTQNPDDVDLFAMPSFSPDDTHVIFEAKKTSDNRIEIKRAEVRNNDSDPISVDILFSEAGKSWWLSEVALLNEPPHLLIGTKGDHGPTVKRNLFCVEINDNGSINGTEKMLTDFPAGTQYTGLYVASLDTVNDRLAFSRMLSHIDSDIYVLNDVIGIIGGDPLPVSYSDPRVVLIVNGSNWQSMCKFSRDGSFVYYAEDANGTYDIQYMYENPAFPFSDTFSEAHFEIFAVNPDALEERIKLNYYRPYSQGILDASPDGTKLFFCSDNRDDGDGQQDVDLYMVTLKVQEEIIALEGGTVADGSGTTLEILADSLNGDTIISITTPVPGDIPSPDTLPEGMQNIALARVIEAESDTVEFNPEYPPMLTIHYTDEEIAGLDELSLKIFVYNEDIPIPAWEVICGEGSLPICTINTEANTITAPLPHLSMFGLSGQSDTDSDEDGIPDWTDNCPDISNTEQEDMDDDGIGDVCDNCPEIANPDQADSNSNGIGDVCDNMPPTAEAGSDQTLEAGAGCAADVTLDGSLSSDPDEDTLSYRWTWADGSATGANPTIQLPLGSTLITLVVNDGAVDSEPDTVMIAVQDTTPPDITLSLSPNILWPPNHKMIEVVPDIQTSDVCCTSINVNLVGVQMNEGDTENTFDPMYDIVDNAGFIGKDIQIVGDSIFLRAERSGKSDGRVYTITYQATDCDGNSSTISEIVTVPHDQS